MVSIPLREKISSLLSLFRRFLGTIPRTPNMTWNFHVPQLSSKVFIQLFASFHVYFVNKREKAKSIVWRLLLFIVNQNEVWSFIWIKWSVCTSRFRIISCVLFYRTDSGLCIYHLLICWNFNFLHSSSG